MVTKPPGGFKAWGHVCPGAGEVATAPQGRGRPSRLLRLGRANRPLWATTPPHLHPEHLSSGRKESPSNAPNPENRQKLRNLILGLKVDPVTDTDDMEGLELGRCRRGEPLTSGERSYRRCPEQQLESGGPEGGPRKAGKACVTPSEPRAPLEFKLPRAVVCRPAH